MHTDKEIGECVLNLDLESEPNKQLTKMITSEEQTIEDIAGQAFILAMKLKRNKTTRPVGYIPPPAAPIIVNRIVKIKFYVNSHMSDMVYHMDVDTSLTVRQLIDHVNATRRVSRTFDFFPFS